MQQVDGQRNGRGDQAYEDGGSEKMQDNAARPSFRQVAKNENDGLLLKKA